MRDCKGICNRLAENNRVIPEDDLIVCSLPMEGMKDWEGISV